LTHKFFYTPNESNSRGRLIQERENFGEQPFHCDEVSEIIVSDINKIKLAPIRMPSDLR
jgi:hypothetical protein